MESENKLVGPPDQCLFFSLGWSTTVWQFGSQPPKIRGFYSLNIIPVIEKYFQVGASAKKNGNSNVTWTQMQIVYSCTLWFSMQNWSFCNTDCELSVKLSWNQGWQKISVILEAISTFYTVILFQQEQGRMLRSSFTMGNECWKLSLVPRPFQPPVFDRLQYANMEGEGLGDLVTCGYVR